MAKIQNQVESRTVKTEMITNETTYSITSKISTTFNRSPDWKGSGASPSFRHNVWGRPTGRAEDPSRQGRCAVRHTPDEVETQRLQRST